MPPERKRAWPAHACVEGEQPHSAQGPPPAPFRFCTRRVRIDWRTLHGVDIDRLVRARRSNASALVCRRASGSAQSALLKRGSRPR